MNTLIVTLLVVVLSAFIFFGLPMALVPPLRRGKGTRRVTPAVVFRSLLSLYVFLLTTLFVLLPGSFLYFLVVPRSERRLLRFHRMLQVTARLVVRYLPGVRFSLSNPCGERFDRPAVIICNHQSNLDLMYLMMLSPRLVFLTKDWVWRNAFFGFLVRRACYYPVSEGMARNVERLRPLVSRGYSVVVFPEGTRSADGDIHRFHQGAFHLAAQLGIEVLPLFLHGVNHALPKMDFMLYPAHVYLEISSRLSPPSVSVPCAASVMRREVSAFYRKRFAEIRAERETAEYRRRGGFIAKKGGRK